MLPDADEYSGAAMRRSALCLSLLSSVLFFPCAARAEFTISAYTGTTVSADSTVHVRNGPSTYDFDASWDAEPFHTPPYFGVRGTYWLTDFGHGNWGVAIDYTHAKVLADPKPAGVDTLEFTDGLNLLSLNGLYRFQNASRFTPYVGAGVGASIPHVEYQEHGFDRTFKYELAGPEVQALVGVDFKITDQISAFAEYKASYTWNKTDLTGGGSLDTDIFSNHFAAGLSFSFDVK